MLKFISQKKKNSQLEKAAKSGQNNQPIPSADLESEFEEVVKMVRNREIQLKKAEYLQLYGLYKQVKDGDNNLPVPSVVKVLDRQKWTAWNNAKGMSRTIAMQHYIKAVQPNKAIEIPTQKIANEEIVTKKIEQQQTTSTTKNKTIEKKAAETSAKLVLNGKGIQTNQSIEFKFTVIGDAAISPEMKLRLVPRKNKYVIPFQLDYLGKPRALRCSISMDSEGVGEWFLKDIELHIQEVELRFQFNYHANIQLPCSELILFESSGWLPQQETPFVRKARLIEQGLLRNQFRWAKNNVEDQPGYGDFSGYEELPEEEHFIEKGYVVNMPEFYEKETDFPAKDLAYYLEQNQKMNRIPRVAENDLWKSDKEFGRMFLQGAHCNFIEHCTELPENLNIEANFLIESEEHTIGELIKAGLIFKADYKILDGVKAQEGYFNAAPIVLFLSRPELEEFVPIIIQLSQNKSENPLVFTPEDGEYDWLIAKSFARLADASYHQLVSHFLMTHASIEALGVASYRILPSYHPVMQLLRPYLKHIFATSFLARNTLLNPGGWIDQFAAFGGDIQKKLVDESYKNLSLKTFTNLPKDLVNRKVTSKKLLPNYPFRDDGMLIWNAIRDHVKSVLSVYYKTDDMVKKDFLIQEWMTEFRQKGWKYSDFPKTFERLNDLTEFVTSMIWTASALHGSMNYNQFEVYGFKPFGSISLMAPPPTKKGATEQDFINILPNHKVTSVSLAVLNWLSMHFEEDIHLGGDERIFSSNQEVRFALLQFRNKLRKIEKIIDERNNLREVPYPIFKPSLVANSIII